MNVRLTIKTQARSTRQSSEDPPLDFEIRLAVQNANRGDAVLGVVEKALAEANKAVAKTLETRRY